MIGGAKVIITGCNLYIAPEGKWLHGDLWALPGVFIFNGVHDARGEAAWDYPPQPYRPLEEQLVVIAINNTPYFERRGIVVLEAAQCRLTSAAQAYIGRQG